MSILVTLLCVLLMFLGVCGGRKARREMKDELFQAVYIADLKRVEFLLSIDPNIITSRPPVLVNRIHEPHGRSSIMVCGIDPQKERNELDKDCVKIVEQLHKAGADIAAKDKTGWDALSLAAFRGLTRVCRYLLDTNQLNINHVDSEGRSALMKAAGNGYNSTYHLLARYGADLSQKDFSGRTSLHYAVLYAIKNHGEGLGILRSVLKLHHNFSISNLVDHDGRNGLMYAAIANDEYVVKAILQAGTDTSRIDNFGLTASQMTSSTAVRDLIANASIRNVLESHEQWAKERSAAFGIESIDGEGVLELNT